MKTKVLESIHGKISKKKKTKKNSVWEGDPLF